MENINTREKPVLKLTGADGNVFNVLGLAQQAAKRADWTEEKIQEFIHKATHSHSYDAVLQLCFQHFDVQ